MKNGMCTHSAIVCSSCRATGFAIGLVLLAFGCKSPMTGIKVDARAADAHTDAGPDAPTASDLAPDDLGPPDLPGKDAVPDSAAADLPPTLVVPKSFRFDNRTSYTAYLPSTAPVQCVAYEATGAVRDCCFFLPECSIWKKPILLGPNGG
jgi:hypothetical protein